MTKSGATAALGALAQETRLDIFRLLVERGPEGMPAGEIGERLKLPSPTLSFHLNQLRYAGLIRSRRESRSIIYSANFNVMNGLMAFLTDKCCGGRPELCSPAIFPPAACAPGECAPGVCEPAGEQLVQLRKPAKRVSSTTKRRPVRSDRKT